MKTNHKIWLTFLAGASLAGCADQEIDNIYDVEKPCLGYTSDAADD
ncbi:MAG: hypothetical protein K2F68_07635 [Duncaniella sp.]|nr:hypothetical protein [Duncaniella sp.]